MFEIQVALEKLDKNSKEVVRYLAYRHAEGAGFIDEEQIAPNLMVPPPAVDTALNKARDVGLIERYIGFDKTGSFTTKNTIYIPDSEAKNNKRYARILTDKQDDVIREFGGFHSM